MSTLGWMGSLACLWSAFAWYRWRRDVVPQRRGRARDRGRKAAGHLPQFEPARRRLVLICLWAAAVYAAVSIESPSGRIRVAWILAILPPVLWGVLAGLARRSLRRGHNATALRLNGILLWLAPDSASLLCQRGGILFAAGRLDEAAAALRKALAQGRREAAQVPAMESLGRVLTAQGRHEEAGRAITAAIKLMSRRSRLHSAMAETFLWPREAGEPRPAELEEALALTNCALDYEGKSTGRSGPNCFAELWADQAWAFALLGRRDPALQAVRRALDAIDDTGRPQAAGVYWRLGMALRSAAQDEAAAKYFKKACAADPEGLFGTLASKALDQAG